MWKCGVIIEMGEIYCTPVIFNYEGILYTFEFILIHVEKKTF